MNELWKHFYNDRVLLTVIHVESLQQALLNLEIAYRGGADGAFLINHSISASELISIYNELHTQGLLPLDFWIGMNCLDLDPTDVFSRIPKTVQGVWVDNAGVDDGPLLHRKALEISEARKRSGWKGLYFGGVAFKYQTHVADPAEAARRARIYVEVITTSGEKTGCPPDVRKIAAMRRAINYHPLAVARGISAENVVLFKPLVNIFLVSTSISDSFTMLNQSKVRYLADLLHR